MNISLITIPFLWWEHGRSALLTNFEYMVYCYGFQDVFKLLLPREERGVKLPHRRWMTCGCLTCSVGFRWSQEQGLKRKRIANKSTASARLIRALQDRMASCREQCTAHPVVYDLLSGWKKSNVSFCCVFALFIVSQNVYTIHPTSIK